MTYRPRANPSRRFWLVAALWLVGGCAPDAPDEPQPAGQPAADTTLDATPAQRFERRVVFLAEQVDSVLAVAWMLDAASTAEGVERTGRGLLLRAGEWETFFDDRWSTPPSRAPWRIVPRGALRMVVGETEALESLIYSQAPRELEVVLGDVQADWTGRRGEALRLLDGGLVLGGARVEGRVLDLSRTAEPGLSPGGDWAFLVSGDSLHVVLHASGPRAEDRRNPYQAWIRLDFRDLVYPDVTVRWAETRAFERARRDVPSRWMLDDPSGRLGASLDVASSWLQAGEGPGPQLPVDALFEVVGTLTIEGVPYPVRGLFRHTQE